MGLQELWFFLIAVLFLGFLVLEGFDFGVGMLMAPLGLASATGDPEQHRRAVLNTIGPVWDGNEVWLITAGGAMFAAFPNWYATVFSALYLPLLAILFGMIVRIVGIEWRGKIDDPQWRRWADIGIAARFVAARDPVGGGVRDPVARLADRRRRPGAPGDRRRAQPLHSARRAGHRVAVPVLRSGVRRPEDRRAPCATTRSDSRRVLSVPVIVLVGGFGLWTQLALRQDAGPGWRWRSRWSHCWPPSWLDVAGARAKAGRSSRPMVVIAAVVVLIFGSHVPEPGAVDAQSRLERDDLQRLVDPVHAADHDVGLADPAARW